MIGPGGDLIRPTNHPKKNGYLYVTIKGKSYLAHRLVWESVHGKIAEDMDVDHINGIKTDNRISNLRVLSRKHNKENQVFLQKNNSSGVRGVTYHKKSGKWAAQIKHQGKLHYLGAFNSIEEAASAYANAAAKYHKYNPSALTA